MSVEGQKGLEAVKDWELVKDCLPAGHRGGIMDLEDAANAEELCKIREEKAEMRVRLCTCMMMVGVNFLCISSTVNTLSLCGSFFEDLL